MWITVKHRLRHHAIDPETEILVIGTFSPEHEDNPADSFYGRVRNHFWRLITAAYDEPSLKGKSKEEKMDFSRKHKIDFIDLIRELRVETGHECNYNDDYIDNKVTEWYDVIAEISRLPKLRKVCFTRKSFGGVPNLKARISEIEQFCIKQGIEFKYLTTPSRFYSEAKEEEWREFFRS
ncbi:MAG: hypothetical protein K0R65_2973 [Crocinitomicaceae bacterium]|jgi:G:T/U-mismatch repair DNA glycosylase|nr:hypothetical protein [Crocinitomicaceae bacterium]